MSGAALDARGLVRLLLAGIDRLGAALLFATGLGLAHLTGCRVDESRSHPCPVAGFDLGGLLYTLLMMGWLLIPLLPFMALTLLLGAGTGLLALYRRWRR